MAIINPQFISCCSLNNTQESQFLLVEMDLYIENCTLSFQHVRWREKCRTWLLRKWTITIWSFGNLNLRLTRTDLFSVVVFWFGSAFRFEANRRRINNLRCVLKLILFSSAAAHCKILMLLLNSETIKFVPLTDWTIEPTIMNISDHPD